MPTLENGGIGRDGLTITYHLRHGVRWQDGAPFTSHDVQFTYRAIMNPKTLVSTRHGWDVLARVDTPDPYTAVFRLKHAFAPAVHTFFAHSDAPYFVLPAHLLEKYPDLNRVPFNTLPVGTGPFKVVRWVRGDHIDYVPNDEYFLGKPKLRRIVLHFVPDENTITNQVRAHELDWFAFATPRLYPQLKAIAGVDVHLVAFNANDAILFNTKAPPFDDPRIRRAVGLAIDKPLIVKEATYGTTVAATEDLPSFMWAYDPHAGTAVRDLPAARALLDAAGWQRRARRYAREGRPAADDEPRVSQRQRDGSQPQRADCVDAQGRRHRRRPQGVHHVEALRSDRLGHARRRQVRGGPVTGTPASIPTTHAAHMRSSRAARLQLAALVQPRDGRCATHRALALRPPDAQARVLRIENLLARDAPFVYLWWPRQIEAVNTDLVASAPTASSRTGTPGSGRSSNQFWRYESARRKQDIGFEFVIRVLLRNKFGLIVNDNGELSFRG